MAEHRREAPCGASEVRLPPLGGLAIGRLLPQVAAIAAQLLRAGLGFPTEPRMMRAGAGDPIPSTPQASPPKTSAMGGMHGGAGACPAPNRRPNLLFVTPTHRHRPAGLLAAERAVALPQGSAESNAQAMAMLAAHRAKPCLTH